MFKAVIFDLDGVVADSHPIHKQAWRQLLLEQKQHVSEKRLEIIFEGRKRNDILRHFLGDLSIAELSLLGKRKEELFYRSGFQLRPVPGVLNFLHQLKEAGIQRAIATSASKRRAHYTLEVLSLRDHFSAVLTGDDVQKGKPDPSIFYLAASHLGIDPEQSLVAEDSEAGVRAAKSAGMRCLGIGSGARIARLREKGAEYIVDDFTTLTISALRGVFDREDG